MSRRRWVLRALLRPMRPVRRARRPRVGVRLHLRDARMRHPTTHPMLMHNLIHHHLVMLVHHLLVEVLPLLVIVATMSSPGRIPMAPIPARRPTTPPASTPNLFPVITAPIIDDNLQRTKLHRRRRTRTGARTTSRAARCTATRRTPTADGIGSATATKSSLASAPRRWSASRGPTARRPRRRRRRRPSRRRRRRR